MKKIVYSLLFLVYGCFCFGQAGSINVKGDSGFVYFKNGCLQEKGIWEKSKCMGTHYHYSEWNCGKKILEVTYDSSGQIVYKKFFNEKGNVREEGAVKDNPSIYALMWEREFKDSEDSTKLIYCSCDTILKNHHCAKDKEASWIWTGDGYASLYNMSKTISKCGYYRKYRLIFGLDYIYSREGVLIRIAKYFNGKYIGDCEVKK